METAQESNPSKLVIRGTRVLDLNMKATTRFVINQGGSRCFGPNQEVLLFGKSLAISKVPTGAMVWTFNEETKKREVHKVLEVLQFQNKKPTVRIKLKSGKEIICTEDHKFYYEGGWYSIKHLLSLLDGKRDNLEADTGI
jgi:hypothetical protein